jgi:hypothetical protein
MYKRFYSLKSSSMGIRVLLEEIGTPCVLIPLLPQNPNFFMGYDAEIV